MKPLFEFLWFSALVQAAVVNLFVLSLVCFISVCFSMYTRKGQVGERVLFLWFLALVLAGCCGQLVCFEFVVPYFCLPVPETGRL